MKKANFRVNISNKCFTQNGVSVIGYAHWGKTCLQRETLAAYFEQATTLAQLTRMCKALNGIFAVIVHKDDFLAIGMDLTRVYPVFYAYQGGEWCITDNPYHLLTAQSLCSKRACKHIRSLDTVFATETLVEGIKKMAVAEVRDLQADGSSFAACYFHYTIFRKECSDLTSQALYGVLKASVKRLITVAAGRQIVMPLSAGYDSRIVITLLKECGYPRVLTFTMGTEATQSECHVASKVAQTLGYPHYKLNLHNIAQSLDYKDFDAYVQHLGALSNFCWTSEYVCFKHLKQQGLIENDAVVVPGHAGDFFAGIELSKAQVTEKDSFTTLAIRLLCTAFESKTSWCLLPQVRRQLKQQAVWGDYSPALYLDFVFRNRLSQFASNSARAYTFYGHQVAFPLWDTEFLQAMRQLSFSQLRHCALYKTCVEQVFAQHSVAFPKVFPDDKTYKKQFFKNLLRSVMPQWFLRVAKKQTDDELGCWAVSKSLCEGFEDAVNKASKPFSINSCQTEWYVGTVKKYIRQLK